MKKNRFVFIRDFILFFSSFEIAALFTRRVLYKAEFLMDLTVFMAVFSLLAGLCEIAVYLADRIRSGNRKPNWELLKSNLITFITASVFGAVYYLVGGQTKQKMITYIGCLILVGCLFSLIKKVVKLLTNKDDNNTNKNAGTN